MMKHMLVAFVAVALTSGCVFGKGEDAACAQYCDLMEEHCPNTGFGGGSTEHNRTECLAACAEYDTEPALDEDGDEIPLGDPVPDGDTLACRVYHANNAKSAQVHCGHASPGGADTCVAFKEPCDQFCAGAPSEPGVDVREDGFNGVVEFCRSAPDGPAFEDTDACAAFCNGIPKGNPDDAAGRTRYCYLNKVLEIFEADDQTQCVEVSPESTVCGGG